MLRSAPMPEVPPHERDARIDPAAADRPPQTGVGARRDDWDLVRAYLAGDTDAFEALTQRHTGLVHHLFARRGTRLRGFTDADEVANETWNQALRQIRAGTVPLTRSCSSWIGGICLNVLRERPFRRESPGDGPDELESLRDAHDRDEAAPDTQVAEAELHSATRGCIDALAEPLRVVFNEIYIKGGTNVTTAGLLGCTEANVRRKLRPKLERSVARCLERKGFRGDDPRNRGSIR